MSTEWFQQSFGERYLELYAHRDREEAASVLDTVLEAGDLVGKRVLDVGCGPGRYTAELQRRGAQATGLDLSWPLLHAASDLAPELELVRADMRRLPFVAASFHAALSMFTSFGYFSSVAEHRDLALEISRVARHLVILDVPNPTVLTRSLVPHTRRSLGTLVVDEVRWLERDPLRVCKTVEVRRPAGGEVVERYEERVLLFVPEELEAMFAPDGWRLRGLWGDYDGSTYDVRSSPRSILRLEREA